MDSTVWAALIGVGGVLLGIGGTLLANHIGYSHAKSEAKQAESNRYRQWLLDRRHQAYVDLITQMLDVQYAIGECADFIIRNTIDKDHAKEKVMRRMETMVKLSPIQDMLNRERAFLAPQVGLAFHRFVSGYFHIFNALNKESGDRCERGLAFWCSECQEDVMKQLEDALPDPELSLLRWEDIEDARAHGQQDADQILRRLEAGEPLISYLPSAIIDLSTYW